LLIGLISDTHIDSSRSRLPPQLKDVFKDVELILHAGDIWIPSVLDELESIAPVKAAWGDDDMQGDLGGDKRMMNGHKLVLEGVTLWLTHVKPRYASIRPKGVWYLTSPGPEEPYETAPEVAVFGHSHRSTVQYHEGVLLVNPGSATFPDYQNKIGTVGLMSIKSGQVEARIVQMQ
jgi:uncharacterized protein